MRGDDTSERHTRIHRSRAIVLGVLRCGALVMVVVGLILVANRVLFGLWGTGNITQGWSSWRGIGQWHGIFLGVPLVGAGVLLGFFSTRLSGWIVRAPGMGCARCSYETLDENGRCSECGYR
ncbi:MAG: hypothetical protein ACX94C_12675 [Phycisphaerales bacterium]